MADIIDYKIYGDDMQVVDISLDPGEGVRAEAGTMMYKTQGIRMQTNADGGVFKGVKRMIVGETFFITSFVYTGVGKGHVGFGAPYPGKIVPLDLSKLGETFLCQKDAFLCAAAGIDIDIAFTKKLGAGFFGGEGFILQKLTGDGLAFIHAGGTVIKRTLDDGERIELDTGCLAALSPTVDYNINFVGGFKNALFGGEGLFLATLTGPGVIYIQTLPFSRLADRIYAAAGAKRGEQKGVAGFGGKLLGGFISGDSNF